MRLKFLLSLLLMILMFQFSFAQEVGIQTEQVLKRGYNKIYYISSMTGADNGGNGSMQKPWKTIAFALSKIKDASASNKCALEIAEGKYGEPTIHTKEFVDLYGGFDTLTWNRNIIQNETVLEGQSKNRIMIASDNSKIDGFVFRNGLVRGKGAAIQCVGVSPTISNNIFRTNKTLKPKNWHPKYWHRTANDGGAIYCSDGSLPIISNNVFYKNKTENGRGAGIAMDNKCGGKIINNFFYQNVSGLDDPMRSSDGGAVSIFRWSHPLVENNIIIENKSLAHNDAGGVWVALWSSPKIEKNVFLNNECGDDAGALFIGGQEHRYAKALDPMPPKDKFYITVDRNIFMGNRNPSNNSGVTRFTMESRGIFSNNLCAYNNGVYFQRSEAEIVNNTMLENFLLIETKSDLKGNKVYNNIIWGDMNVDAPSDFANNDLKQSHNGENNFTKDPDFKNDSFQIIPYGTSYDLFKFVTTVFMSGAKYKDNEFKGRIVKAGDKWGVVKSNNNNNIEIWGDLSGSTEITMLPSFNLDKNSPCIDAGKKVDAGSHDVYGNNRTSSLSKIDIGAIEH